MTGLSVPTLMSGMTLLLPKMNFESTIATKGGDDGGNAGIVGPVPSTFYVQPLSDRLRFGVALTARLGGGVDYGSDFVGRFSAIKVKLTPGPGT